MKAFLHFTLIFLSMGLAAFEYRKTTTWFGEETFVSSFPNESALVGVQDTGVFFATGKAATNLTNASNKMPSLEPLPRGYVSSYPPIPIQDNSGQAVGYWYNVDQKDGFYLTAKHVLQKIEGSKVVIDDNFLEEYSAFEILVNNQPIDLILIIKKQLVNNALKGEQLNELLELNHVNLSEATQWLSYQHGTIETNIDSQQWSSGLLNRWSDVYFWLAPSDYNFSSPGSSGAPVWLRRAESNNWQLSGFIICDAKDTENAKGGTRVVSANVLVEAKLRLTQLLSIINQQQNADADCKPLGRPRLAGGF